MRYHPASDPVYAPNSYGDPKADPERLGELHTPVVEGQLTRSAYDLHAEDDDYTQPGTLIRQVMSDGDRDHLVSNIVGHLRNGVTDEMLPRVYEYWRDIDDEIGARVQKEMNGA